MTNGPIDIAMCIDGGMLGPALVALYSISIHADPHRDIRVHVITTGRDDLASAIHDGLDRASFRIFVTKVDNPYASFPENAYISPATYLRFLLPELLTVDKVLYLDADIIATCDIGRLFDAELGLACVGAVPDFAMSIGSVYQSGFKLFYEGRDYDFSTYVSKVVKLQRPKADTYFNAGVMLIDLNNWRMTGFVGKAVGFLSRHPGLSFFDQDGLNAVCGGDYLRLDHRWNSIVGATGTRPVRWRDRISASSRRWTDICTNWLEDPWIIHFAGPTKPWNSTGSRGPMDQRWWSYAERSPAAAMFGAPSLKHGREGSPS